MSAFGGIVACNRAWCLVEHVKSNAIVVAKEGVVRGMGARAEESHRFSQGSHHRANELGIATVFTGIRHFRH